MAASDPAELTRKLRQHDHEFESVYELLQNLDRKVDTGFAQVDERFDRADERFDRVDRRLGGVDERLSQLTAGQQELITGQQQIMRMLREMRGGESPTRS